MSVKALSGPSLPISRPWIGAEELAAIRRPLESGWVVQGPCVGEFEEKFARFTGVRYAAAASSCTAALHLAVVALGLEPGDEVIVPAFTWVATANVVEYRRARPVFCDIDPGTYNIDVDQLASLVTPRTVGIIPVHLFGLCADMDRIRRLAERHALWVVEDAACAFGARIGDRYAGTFGDAGCFSFHPRKAITTGEGGMVTTARQDLDRRVRSLRDHGASSSDLARHVGAGGFLMPEYDELGYNYRMTDIQGALGSAQMDRADHILAARRRHAAHYDAWLGGVPAVRVPACPSGYEHGYQSYVCSFEPEPPSLANVDRLHARRNAIMARLEAQGIATRQGTHAPPFTGYYAARYGAKPEDFPNAFLAERLTLSLPLYAQLEDDDLRAVCDALSAACHA